MGTSVKAAFIRELISTWKPHDGIEIFHSFLSKAADLVVSYGGSLSGEHGDGQSKAEFLPKMFGDELVAGIS